VAPSLADILPNRQPAERGRIAAGALARPWNIVAWNIE
jgi:hypothetical protein